MTNQAARAFLRCLRRQQRTHQAGMALRELLRVLGYALIALLLFAAADYLLSFSVMALRQIGSILLWTGMALLLVRLIHVLRFSRWRYAAQVDTALADRRRTVYSALELATARSKLDEYLSDSTIQLATQRLQSLRPSVIWPMKSLSRQARNLVFQVLLVGLVLGIPHSISTIVLERIFFPDRDRPPFSPYTFAVTPESPEVLYGQGVELSVEITGHPVRDAVWLLTRRNGTVQRAACFQESSTQFAQRLEQLIHPVEFAFSVGRARSEWFDLDILYDPRIVDAHVAVVPPAYTGRPKRTSPLADPVISALAGAKLILTLESNRPLRDGLMTIRHGLDADEQEVQGRLLEPQRVEFTWTLEQDGMVDVVLRDVRGTRNQAPFEIEQLILPDHPPRVAMTEPAGFALATPDAMIQLAGYAEDDIGLRRVELARGMAGYRDRLASLLTAPGREQFDFAEWIDLSELGVEPGQTLEFFMEAQDTNPDWTGLAVSDVVRIEIIDSDEYVRLWQSRTRTEEFMQRYRDAMSAVERIKESIRETVQDWQDGKGDAAEREAQLAALKEEYDAIQERLERLSRDLPIFAAEHSLHSTLGEMADMLSSHRPALADRSPDDPRLQRRLERVLSDLEAFDHSLHEDMETARHIAQVARVFEMTQHYLQLVHAQEQLMRRLERYPDPSRLRAALVFDYFEREESAIRAALVQFREELLRRAQALDDEYAELRQTSIDFAEAIQELEIPSTMERAILAARQRGGMLMVREGELALELMRQLLSDCSGNAFGGLMDCELRFRARPQARATLQQMMDAWSAVGMGMGPGGGVGDGYSVQAMTPLNVPMFGPGRSLHAMPVSGGGEGQERGAGRGAPAVDERHRLETDPRSGVDDPAAAIEQAPEKYRDALRRYFGISDE